MATALPLARGIDYGDLNFVGIPGVIATALIHGPDGVAIVDPGPTTTLGVLEQLLNARGFGWTDVKAILLTHIHLDHAGGTGAVLERAPDARVYVHERGAPHIVDPSKLIVSAGRLYQDDMERLWGDILPVPADRLHVIGDTARLRVCGHDVEVTWTPGHAWHHVSYFLPGSSIAFVGDTAGIIRPQGRLVIPPTPPPDIDLEAWRASTDRIMAWNPDTLFLTHYGPQTSPAIHFQALWRELDRWSRKVQASLAIDGIDDGERAAAFVDDITAEISRSTSRDEAESYARAGRFDFSWTGLARYWRRKERSHEA